MTSEEKPVILLAASTWFPLSTHLALALLRHGCRVSAICPKGHPLRLVPGIGSLYRYSGARSLQSLHHAIIAANPDLLVPCDDGVVHQLHSLHAHHPELRPLIEHSLGAADSYPIVASRGRLLALAASLGIRTPVTRPIHSESDLTAWPYESAVLKTNGSSGGNGVAITHTPSAFLAAFRYLSQPLTAAIALKRALINRNPLALWFWRTHPQPELIAQQFIPQSRPANTMIACWQGEVLASVTVETICSQGATGAATVVRFLHHPEIEEASRKLARSLILNGFHGLDFMLEAHDNPSLAPAWLIEMNPRCTQLGHLNLPGQGDLAGILLAKLQNAPPPNPSPGTPIEGDTVAFYPQALAWNPQSPYITHGYHDIPTQAPALLAELRLEEWPLRQWPARLYHHFFPIQYPQNETPMTPTSAPINTPISDVAIVGAGPYGLSIAAYLAGGKLHSRIFGTPMHSWASHMPRGMKLKSEGFASSLYDPASAFPLRQYCSENNLPYQDVGLPVPIETFVAYGQEFQRRLVPHLETTDIVSIQKSPAGFTLQTTSGETLQARNVIVATGITHFEQTPAILAALPAGYVSHTFNHSDLTPFNGRKVAVLGAGSSAIDTAALLRDAGADVHIIARASSIAFHSPGSEPRPLIEHLKNPRSGLGVGWKSKFCSDLPLLFHALPQKLRIRAVKRHLGPSSGWFVREKVEGHIPMHLKSSIQSAHIEDNQIHLNLTTPNGPEPLTVDHIIVGTGFYPALSRLPMLDDQLRNSIETLNDAPILSRQFESSVPGLYFIGLASSISFGPLMRFACGAEFTAKRLAKHLFAQ